LPGFADGDQQAELNQTCQTVDGNSREQCAVAKLGLSLVKKVGAKKLLYFFIFIDDFES